jgi:hypothetical protein
MIVRTALLAVMGLVAAGCATPDTVMMRNRQSGEIAQCAAAYRSFFGGLGYRQQDDCIAQYERNGFERDLVPAAEK